MFQTYFYNSFEYFKNELNNIINSFIFIFYFNLKKFSKKKRKPKGKIKR